MPDAPPPLHPALARAVAEGIVTRAQAEAIAALEDGPATPGRRSVVPEVLGYLGGALAVVAALLLGREVWHELGPVVRVLLLAVVTAAVLAAGGVLGGRSGPAGRLGGFLWAVAVVALSGTVGVAASDLFGVPFDVSAVLATAGALALAAVLWWLRPEVLQHVAAFAAAAATLFAVVGLVDDRYRSLGPLLWVLGLAWIAGAASGRLRPAPAGWVLGALAVVAGPLGAGTGRSAWAVVGVLSAAALVVLGVRGHRQWLLAIGTAGLFVAVPVAVAEIFDAELGPLLGLLVVGLVLVALAVVLTRRRPGGAEDRPGSNNH
ncbi:DUF2157 domain-containing protein [Pseudonocardia kunmingensis]|uniref:Putative membrane protein DUF2157 n=1 Tax=Pseudonocardia kunmingensis TaxID=630975 RepID=A0A543DJQ8_9PSEU|nr:DUF2157 domain-containing protein [Pseudonocardia kunmingensis]TQM09562.1 putative membrane protein DUF2157 [Pseudonocardia kunmingensis]